MDQNNEVTKSDNHKSYPVDSSKSNKIIKENNTINIIFPKEKNNGFPACRMRWNFFERYTS